jgi:hypothetical protein
MRDGQPSIGSGGKPSEPGWLGLELLDGDKVDWKTIVALGDGTVRVRVAAPSPARKAGLRSKDYVISINGVNFEKFHAGGLQVGTKAVIKAWRDGGPLWIEAEIVARPRLKPRNEGPPAVACGAAVGRDERLKWLSQMSGSAVLHSLDKALALRLMVRYASRYTGIAKVGVRKLAADLGMSPRSIADAISRLHRAGYINIKSGKKGGLSNEYTPTWPSASGANVLRLRPPA